MNETKDNKWPDAHTSFREGMATRIKGSDQDYNAAILELYLESVDTERHYDGRMIIVIEKSQSFFSQ